MDVCILFLLNHAQQTSFKNSKISRKEIKEQKINRQFYETKVLLSSESVVFEADFFNTYGTKHTGGVTGHSDSYKRAKRWEKDVRHTFGVQTTSPTSGKTGTIQTLHTK